MLFRAKNLHLQETEGKAGMIDRTYWYAVVYPVMFLLSLDFKTQ